MIDKQNTDRKKKIFLIILLLCVIMGGTGLFYYKNKLEFTHFWGHYRKIPSLLIKIL